MTDVVFLRELDGDTIFALFPAHAACVDYTDLMVCYTHPLDPVAVSFDYCCECEEVIYNAEFADLFAELEGAGYELYVIRKDRLDDPKYAESRRQEAGPSM